MGGVGEVRTDRFKSVPTLSASRIWNDESAKERGGAGLAFPGTSHFFA
jgi:hypothetical protein